MPFMLSRTNYILAMVLTAIPAFMVRAAWVDVPERYYPAGIMQSCAVAVLILAAIVVLIWGLLKRGDGRIDRQGWILAGVLVAGLFSILPASLALSITGNGFALCRGYPHSVGCQNGPGLFRVDLDMAFVFAAAYLGVAVGIFVINKPAAHVEADAH